MNFVTLPLFHFGCNDFETHVQLAKTKKVHTELAPEVQQTALLIKCRDRTVTYLVQYGPKDHLDLLSCSGTTKRNWCNKSVIPQKRPRTSSN